MRRLAAILLLPLLAHAAATEIRDTAYTAFNGVLFSGKLTITGPDMTTADGRTVHRWEQAYTITSGAISLDLEPNDTATPAGTSYLVRFTPPKGAAWTERWIVPTSEFPLKVNQIRVQTVPSPSLAVQPSQILGGGAADGQSLLWNDTDRRWQPGTVEAGVGSVFGRTGAVTAQSGDYAVADVTGLQTALDGRAATSHGHAEADVTNLVVDLASKPTGSGTQNYLPFWLTPSQLGQMDATWDSLNKILQINGRNGAYLRFGASVDGGPPYMVLDIKPEPTDAFEDFRVRFLNPDGTASSSSIRGSMFGGPWGLYGFSITPSSLNLTNYMYAPGYRMGTDFNPTTISSSSYNFGKLFDGLANGYRKFKLTTSVTSPVFDFAITQPGYVTVLEICQDSTGGRTISFPSNVLFGPLDTNPNRCTLQMLITRTMSTSPWIAAIPLAPATSF